VQQTNYITEQEESLVAGFLAISMRLQEETAGGDCRRRLQEKIAGEDCRRRLQEKIAGEATYFLLHPARRGSPICTLAQQKQQIDH
jgi:hypothetical protein